MPRMCWRPGLRPGPRWVNSRHSQPPVVGWGLGRGTLPKNPMPLGASILALSAISAQRLVSSVYTHLNFSNRPTPLIGSIVISLSRGCLPNDEGPGPPNIFS